VQTLYGRQKHAQAESALAELRALEAREAGPLLTLYRLSSGPIVTTLDNQRLPFLPVAPETPGKNVYPPELGGAPTPPRSCPMTPTTRASTDVPS